MKLEKQSTLTEEAIKHTETLFAQWITEEANAAEVKKEKPIMVVLGNPPYSGHSANRGTWVRHLVDTYKKDIPELRKPVQAKWLQDDYVKFIAFGRELVDKLVEYVRSDSYLGLVSYRLINTDEHEPVRGWYFTYVLEYHGVKDYKEVFPVFVTLEGTEGDSLSWVASGQIGTY